jgi:hypothetical protein
VVYRRADPGEQREAIYRLRHNAYLREGAISADSSGTFSDPYDETDNAYLFGVYIDDQLASSLRLHAASKEHPDMPSLRVFPGYLQPELDAGKVLIDSTYFVADEQLLGSIAACHMSRFDFAYWRPNTLGHTTCLPRYGRSTSRFIGAPSISE